MTVTMRMKIVRLEETARLPRVTNLQLMQKRGQSQKLKPCASKRESETDDGRHVSSFEGFESRYAEKRREEKRAQDRDLYTPTRALYEHIAEVVQNQRSHAPFALLFCHCRQGRGLKTCMSSLCVVVERVKWVCQANPGAVYYPKHFGRRTTCASLRKSAFAKTHRTRDRHYFHQFGAHRGQLMQGNRDTHLYLCDVMECQ